jgi:hypothetical protein
MTAFTLTSILFILALLVLVGIYVARPFLVPEPKVKASVARRQRLLEEKAVLLGRIRDLDFDLETGKMPAAEQAQQRAELVTAAAVILQQLDELAPAVTAIPAWEAKPAVQEIPPAGRRLKAAAVDEDIEAAVARLRRAKIKTAAGADATAAAPPVVAAPPAVATPPATARFCTQCGHAGGGADRFCAACGHKLAEVQPT